MDLDTSKNLKKNLLFYEMFACYGNSPFFVQQYAIESRTQKKTLLNRLFLHENSNRSNSLLLFPFKREWDQVGKDNYIEI